MPSFREYLRRNGVEDGGVRVSSRRSADIDDDEDEPDYRNGRTAVRDREVEETIIEAVDPIEVNKEGRDLLVHNVICAAVAAGAKQIFIFFRRLVKT